MGIDLLVALLVLAAIYFGYQRGLILAVFSFLSFWVGIFLAFKFTALVAGWLGPRISVSDRWLPILSFVLILIGVIVLIRLGAKALESMLELAQLGTFNRVAGALLYSLLLLSVCAAFFQGLQWAGLVTPTEGQESLFIQRIQPLFVDGFQGLSRWIPGGKNLFNSLEQYFREAMPNPPRALHSFS